MYSSIRLPYNAAEINLIIWITLRFLIHRSCCLIALPDVQSNFGITGNTRQSFGVATQYKEEVAFTLAVSPDNTGLFVSAGTEILKINTASFTLTQWRATVELPCRLSHVTEALGKAWTVHAVGSNYVGNGTTVDQYKTHLYAIPAPKN